jgi:hypothetical protein
MAPQRERERVCVCVYVCVSLLGREGLSGIVIQ